MSPYCYNIYFFNLGFKTEASLAIMVTYHHLLKNATSVQLQSFNVI